MALAKVGMAGMVEEAKAVVKEADWAEAEMVAEMGVGTRAVVKKMEAALAAALAALVGEAVGESAAGAMEVATVEAVMEVAVSA
eukprot:2225788-Pleurochrysis_carterae.AAC.1